MKTRSSSIREARPWNLPVGGKVASLYVKVYDIFAGTLCGQTCSQVEFDPSKSSTFVDGGSETSISFATGVGVDPVVGDDYSLTLRSATDTVSVGGLAAANIDLFLITNQTPKFNIDPFSGIQGKPKAGTKVQRL